MPATAKSRYGSIIRHGFYRTKSGKRRRYRCLTCGKTFCCTKGTAYYRLQIRRRTFDEVAALIRDVSNRMHFERIPLVVTDGFDFYEKIPRRTFGPACLYGQVLKTRRNDRVVKVERTAVLGAPRRFEKALAYSEDSRTLNTSFIERLNLTRRQSSAYLLRRTLCHARSKERLEEHLELLRFYYSFVRPHRALKFGRETRTPAMKAGLTRRHLTFREVFLSVMVLCYRRTTRSVFTHSAMSIGIAPAPMPLAAQQHLMAEAPGARVWESS